MKQTLRYILFNGAFLWLLVHGGFNHAVWAENIISALVVIMACLSILFMFAFDTAVKSCKKNPVSVPQWVDMSFDLICAGIMAALGWFWLFGMYVFHMMIMRTIRCEAEKR